MARKKTTNRKATKPNKKRTTKNRPPAKPPAGTGAASGGSKDYNKMLKKDLVVEAQRLAQDLENSKKDAKKPEEVSSLDRLSKLDNAWQNLPERDSGWKNLDTVTLNAYGAKAKGTEEARKSLQKSLEEANEKLENAEKARDAAKEKASLWDRAKQMQPARMILGIIVLAVLVVGLGAMWLHDQGKIGSDANTAQSTAESAAVASSNDEQEAVQAPQPAQESETERLDREFWESIERRKALNNQQ